MDEQPPEVLEYVSPVDEPVPSCIAVISIIGIVLGGMTLLSRLFGVVGSILMLTMASRGGARPMNMGLGYSLFGICSAAVFAGFAVWLIVASIGCLKHLEWGRRWLVRYAVVYGVAVVLEVAASLPVMVPRMSKMMAQVNGGRPGPFPASYLVVIMIGGGLLGAILAMILPVFILIYIRKPQVRVVMKR